MKLVTASKQQGKGIRRQSRFCTWAALSTNAPAQCLRSIDGSDSRGLAADGSRESCAIWGRLRSHLKVRMLKAEILETLMYGCVT